MVFEANDLSNNILWSNCHNYFSSFDGTCKCIDDVNDMFDLVYSDDFVYQVDKNSKFYNKNELRRVQDNFLRLGSKATILLFNVMEPDTAGQCHQGAPYQPQEYKVEYKFRMTNDLLDVVIHNVATVRDNKFIKCQPVDQTSFDAVTKVRDVSDLFDAANSRTTRDSISNILNACKAE